MEEMTFCYPAAILPPFNTRDSSQSPAPARARAGPPLACRCCTSRRKFQILSVNHAEFLTSHMPVSGDSGFGHKPGHWIARGPEVLLTSSSAPRPLDQRGTAAAIATEHIVGSAGSIRQEIK